MAIARVQMICPDCKTEFWTEKRCLNRREANQWESYVSQTERQCPSCYAKAMQAEKEASRAARSEDLAKVECGMDLPDLEGSEKQIKWANDLRNSVINQLNHRGINWKQLLELEKTNEQTKAYVEASGLRNPSSKWWIENRGKSIFRGLATIAVL